MDTENSVKNREEAERRLKILNPVLSAEGRSRSALSRIARDNEVTVRTLQRWLKSYDRDGFNGLIPKRKGAGSVDRKYIKFDDCLQRAIVLRRQDPYISVTDIIFTIESEMPEVKGFIKPSTLQHHLEKAGYSRSTLLMGQALGGRQVCGRYRKEHRFEQLQCDVKEFPRHVTFTEGGMPCTVYLQLWVDNYSRMIVGYKLWTDQKQHIASDSLRQVVEVYGKPDTILTDNGSIYRSAQTRRACELMGIKLLYCRPNSPEGKGLIERVNGALCAIEHQMEGLGVITYEMAAESIRLWIDRYNRTGTKTLEGKSPQQLFETDSRKIQGVPPDIISIAFKHSETRKIAKDGTISFKGRQWKIPLEHTRVGAVVELLYDDSGNLELVLPDFRTVPLFPLELKGQVDKSVLQVTAQPEPTLENCGLLLALLREKKRDAGTYVDEESFMAEIKADYVALYKALQLKPLSRRDNGDSEKVSQSRGAPPPSHFQALAQLDGKHDDNGGVAS